VTRSELTDEDKRDYVATAYGRCPYCRSPDIESGPLSADGNRAVARVVCSSCDRYWDDLWELVGINDADQLRRRHERLLAAGGPTVYHKCRWCDHFLEEDAQFRGMWHHLHDGDVVPNHSGLPGDRRTLAAWQQLRPDLFARHPDGRVGPNSVQHPAAVRCTAAELRDHDVIEVGGHGRVNNEDVVVAGLMATVAAASRPGPEEGWVKLWPHDGGGQLTPAQERAGKLYMRPDARYRLIFRPS
jgi:hypothetical protein